MAEPIKHHPKLLDRWKNIFLSIHKEEGNAAAQEWALRTLADDDTKAVAAILHGPKKK